MLIIIDLQKGFMDKPWSNYKKTKIRNIQERINESIKLDEPIVVLTYKSHGRTVTEITKSYKGYKNKHYVQKIDMDGSYELITYFEKKKMNIRRIELIGAFTEQCVLETRKGLVDKGFEVAKINKTLCIDGGWPIYKEDKVHINTE